MKFKIKVLLSQNKSDCNSGVEEDFGLYKVDDFGDCLAIGLFDSIELCKEAAQKYKDFNDYEFEL